MLKTQALGRQLPITAHSFGLIGILLRLLSYIWIPLRFVGRET
jgi:hypothetical protein